MAENGKQKIMVTALGGSVATAENGITAEVVVVDSFEALEKIGVEGIRNKIVVFNHRFDQRLQSAGFGGAAYSQAVQFRFRGAMEAARFGAIGVLVRSAGGSQNRLVHTGSVGYRDDLPKIPAAAISFEDAELIADLAQQGKTRVQFTITPKTLPDAVSHNVIGDIIGSEKPEEIVVVGGHLDSWDLGTGAIDNASGVAASLQVGHILKELKLRPKRTIRVIAFMEEESGGAGSRAYFEENRNNIDRHFAAVECDLGASRPIGYLYSGKPEVPGILAPLARVLAKTGASQVRYQEGIGADTAPLTRAGVPSFAPWFDLRTYFNYHHTAADTFDKIDPKEYAELSALVAVLTLGLANMDAALPR
ncbi:MAG: M20/M25/M40 family metallo-hydrolase [Acidobacteriota bacterium]|nr:MAG: M20/M25/M40 family metallo-hydrolase [Acidobacteriota bacterium]